MSDIQDLIHKTSIDCIEKGRQMEQERIIKVIEEADSACGGWAIALIKGEK